MKTERIKFIRPVVGKEQYAVIGKHDRLAAQKSRSDIPWSTPCKCFSIGIIADHCPYTQMQRVSVTVIVIAYRPEKPETELRVDPELDIYGTDLQLRNTVHCQNNITP